MQSRLSVVSCLVSCVLSSMVVIGGLALGASGCRSSSPSSSETTTGGDASDRGLRTAASFASIGDRDERARAIFTEAARVLSHPRCANCHPADGRPRQGDGSIMHVPPIWGGDDGRGVPAQRCTSCHQAQNYEELAMPGAPDWHLAPDSMVFLGRSAGEICATLVGNSTRGGMSIEAVIDHVGDDKLVAWGFAPGPKREPPPGSQRALHDLFEAWAAAGAACPQEGSR